MFRMIADPLGERRKLSLCTYDFLHVRLLWIIRGYPIISDAFRSCKKPRGKNRKSTIELVSSQLSSASYLGIIPVNAKPPFWIFFSLVNEWNSGRELRFRDLFTSGIFFPPDLSLNCATIAFLRRAFGAVYYSRACPCSNSLRLQKIRIL